MMVCRYLHLDVFTDRLFEGNQLAVFPEPRGLSATQMQAIALEMNFSESTFIFPAEKQGDVRMRIFTPLDELPIAGHPTIGSTFALAEEGVIAPGRAEFVFELGVGPIPVSLEWDDQRLSFAWMTQPQPSYGAAIEDRPALAAALGIDERTLVPGLPAQMVSCGVPYLFVALASRAEVDEVAIDRRKLARCCGDAGLDELPVFFFTTDQPPVSSGTAPENRALSWLPPSGGRETVYSRMLAPGFGISEDPATGSASGPLGCYLLHHGVVSGEQARSMVSLQGVAMGRPSRVFISIDSRDGLVTRVRVGGKSVLVGRGELRL